MQDRVRRFLGDSPLRLLVRLVVLSLVAGVVMSALDLRPWDIFGGLERLLADAWARSAELVRRGTSYVALGAMVVVPLWVFVQLLQVLKGRR